MMVAQLKSFRSGRALAGLVAVACLVACVPETSEPGGAGGSAAGTGGRNGSAGSSQGGTGGSGGKAGDAGGSVAGAGGSAGQAGRGGSNPGGADGGGGIGAVDAGSMGAADTSGDAITSAIPGYAVCVLCHGPTGAGVIDKGPEIQHPVVDFSTWVVRNGRVHPAYKEPMLKFPPETISDAQLQGIFTFLASPPKPTTGAALYKDYCENCHGSDGKGGVTMRDISAQPVAKFLTDSRAGHHPGEFSNRREYMPKWTAAELSDAEIRLIFTYVDGL
jgi:mono/diheme cytochrome c family protein